MLFFLIAIGSAIFVSAFVVLVRKRAFENKFRTVIEERKKRESSRAHSRSASRGRPSASEPAIGALSLTNENDAFQQNRLTKDTGKGVEPSSETPEASGQSSALPHGRTGNQQLELSTDRAVETVDGIAARSVRAQREFGDDDDTTIQPHDRITFSPDTRFRSSLQDDERSLRKRNRPSFLSMQGVGANPSAEIHAHVRQPSLPLDHDEEPASPAKSRSRDWDFSGHVARNSQFHGLTEHEREQLGGAEYKAVYWLSWIVPLYFILWQLLGCLGLGAYVANNRADTARMNGLNPWWVGAFNAVSAFNNSGMSLLDANMTAFQTSYYMLITMGLLILAGNTCYPIFLRLIVWTMLKLMPDNDRWQDHRSTLHFLLDHPRRCYTNLFPSRHTWWLLLAVVTLNGIDWAAFEVLNIGNGTLNDALPVHIRVIDGLFQAFAVRSGGFYVVAIPTLRISLQALYVIMMYISVYPVVITMRNSNVYEERSLGIYSDDPGFAEYERAQSAKRQGFWGGVGILRRHLTGEAFEESTSHFVRQQLRAQLAHDAWWIVLAVFVIMIIEGSQFERDPATFSVFNFIFEIVSGYGCVGISVGVPNDAYSFCGSWHKLSKLVLCAVMIRGRHRGLPVAIDQAVLLPGEHLGRAEEEDAMIRLERAVSRGRTLDGEERV